MTADDRGAREPRDGWPQVPPGLAGILSFVAPGLGHLALRLWSRGATWLVGWVVIGAMSQGSHSIPMLVLMAIAGVDAYLCARDRERELKTSDTHPA